MKLSNILVLIFIVFIIWGILSFSVNAAEIDNSKIDVKSEMYSSNGSFNVTLSNITLDTTHQYEFGISANQETEPENYFSINNLTNNLCVLNLNASIDEIVNILKTTNTVYAYVNDKTNSNEQIIKALPVDVTLPLIGGINMYFENNYLYIDHLYGNTSASYQFQKITDEDIINAYNQITENGEDLKSISNMLTNEVPQTGWKNMTSEYPTLGHSREHRVTDELADGLYYVWGQLTGQNNKNLYGYILYMKGQAQTDGNGPIVDKIDVISPESGSYGIGQEIKIRVVFDEAITAETVPTLTIKFGEGQERELTNGIISNNVDHYIEYTYTIREGDVGQLMAVNLEGGNVKDDSGNNAILTCPAISGNAIVANRDIDINIGDENNNENNSNNGENNNGGSSNNNNDGTTAPGKLPQTGETILIISSVIVCVTLATVGLIKYRGMKDIK